MSSWTIPSKPGLTPLSPTLLPSAFPQVLSPLTERDRSWRLWSNFEARKRHISLKYIFRKLALFLFSSEYTKRSVVDLNFAVPPLFPFLFSVQFLPDALRSLFVQAKTHLCQNLSNLWMDNLSLSRPRVGQPCTLFRVRQVGEDRDRGHCFERFRLRSERDAANLSLSG